MQEDRGKIDLRALNGKWNRTLKLLGAAERAWDEMQKDVERATKAELEFVHPRMQKGLAMFGKAKFLIALPKLVSYFRSQDGMRELLIPSGELGSQLKRR